MSYSRSNAAAAAKEAKVIDLFQQITLDQQTSQTPSSNDNKDAPNLGKNTTNTDCYCLFVGEKSSGKSSLISLFMGKEDDPKPTIALDYQFARRPRAQSTNNSKDVSHVWELGGGLDVVDLIGVTLERGLGESCVCVVVDCGRGENVVGR